MYQDRNVTCQDCGATFVFTAGEQEFYAEKGFENDPKRCKECRSKKKAEKRNDRGFRREGQRNFRSR